MSTTQARSSHVDAVFDRMLSELPVELLTAMRKHKLGNPGTLRSYPRTSSLGVLSLLSRHLGLQLLAHRHT